MSILVGVLPSITARKPIAAWNKVSQAFEAYYKAGGVEKASVLAQNRYIASRNNGVPLADIARYEVGGSTAVLVNTAPAAFWTLLLLYSHPGLLDDIRKEIDACTNGTDTKTIDITTLKEACPLFCPLTKRCFAIGQWVPQSARSWKTFSLINDCPKRVLYYKCQVESFIRLQPLGRRRSVQAPEVPPRGEERSPVRYMFPCTRWWENALFWLALCYE